jgi:Putative DNA-binding HTH domain
VRLSWACPASDDRGRRYDREQRKPEFRRKALIKTHARQKAHLGADDPRLARAIFTLRETAGYLDVPKSNIQRWARPPEAKHPLITCFPPHGREATVPFIGFAEAFVLSSFRRAGVPLQRIRPAVEVLEKEIGVVHALASKRLYTDGAEVLFDYANKRGERKVMDLVVVRTQQRQFSGVVKDYLKRIRYGGDGWAEWRFETNRSVCSVLPARTTGSSSPRHSYVEVCAGFPGSLPETADFFRRLKFGIANLLVKRLKEADSRLEAGSEHLDEVVQPGNIVVTSNWDFGIEHYARLHGVPVRWRGLPSCISKNVRQTTM